MGDPSQQSEDVQHLETSIIGEKAIKAGDLKSYHQWNGMQMSVLASFNVLETGACPVVFHSGNTRSPHFSKLVLHYDYMFFFK